MMLFKTYRKLVVLLLVVFASGVSLFSFADKNADKTASIVKTDTVVTEKANEIPIKFEELSPTGVHRQSSRYIAKLINSYHYLKPELNDKLSEMILDDYIEMLDGNKSYFLKSDVESFQQYRHSLDNSIENGWLKPAFHIYSVFRERWLDRNRYATGLLEKPMDFTVKEEFMYDREDVDWPQTTQELDELWRKRVKYDALNLVLADKTWDEAKDILKKRYKAAMRRVSQTKNEDVFSYFMNVYTNIADPHTSYLSPRSAENFDIGMKLSLEGIGAVLQSDDVYTKVNRIVEAGPADKQGELSVDDKVIAVGQDKEPLVDVVGWRLDDVVDLIRGKAGTVVRLEIEPANATVTGKTKVITIVREKVKLEEQAAKSEIIEVKQDDKIYKIGVIDLPTFYVDFRAKFEGKKDYRSTTKDIEKLIAEMEKEQGIDALIIDLRSNGGGALTEAISLTGLFIDKGPVVQDRDQTGHVEVHQDTERGVAWNGPLAVMINGTSASASEIFAAAIQDYGRGLIIGEQTFGKGTVQRMLDLNREIFSYNEEQYGDLKLTVNKFYRINGGSTQNKGVMPDIQFPDPYSRDDFGEQSFETALPWDSIDKVDFAKSDDLSQYFDYLYQRHLSRIQNNTEFQYLIDDISEIQKRHDETTISLNLEERKQKRKDDKDKQLKRENERRKAQGKELIKEIGEDTELVEVDDVKLNEAANIVVDFTKMKKGLLVAQNKADESELKKN